MRSKVNQLESTTDFLSSMLKLTMLIARNGNVPAKKLASNVPTSKAASNSSI